MKATRRQVLRAGVAAVAVGAAGGLDAFPRRRADASPGPLAPRGTTLQQTLLRGPVVNDGGYRLIVTGPGEPHVVREDLGIRAQAGRADRRRGLLSFAQLTDIHVIDAQSPARVEFLDRYNDGPGSGLLFAAAYRPQEVLTAQVSDALVRAVNRVGRGPVTGIPLAFTIATGDNVDNAQFNELRWVSTSSTASPSGRTPATPTAGKGCTTRTRRRTTCTTGIPTEPRRARSPTRRTTPAGSTVSR